MPDGGRLDRRRRHPLTRCPRASSSMRRQPLGNATRRCSLERINSVLALLRLPGAARHQWRENLQSRRTGPASLSLLLLSTNSGTNGTVTNLRGLHVLKGGDRSQCIALAKEWYATIRAGIGNPYNQVPFIRARLAEAGVLADVLDPAGNRPADDIERELDEALARSDKELAARLLELVRPHGPTRSLPGNLSAKPRP